MATREGIIKLGQQRGLPTERINKALQMQGFEPIGAKLNSIKLKPKQEYNLGSEIVTDLRDITSGLGTAYTMAVQSAKHPIKTSQNISKYMNDRGAVGMLKDLANAGLSTYNTSVGDIARNGSKVLPQVIEGAKEHPVFTAMDLLTLGAGRPLGVVGKLGVEALHEAPLVPKIVKNLLPTAKMNEVNAIIKNRKLIAETGNKELKGSIEKLGYTPDVDTKAIVKSYTTGTELPSTANQATRDAHKAFYGINKDINKQLTEVTKLTEDVTKKEAVSKYVLEHLDPDRKIGMDISDVKGMVDKYRAGDKWDKKLPITREQIGKLVNDGEDLYDTGKVLHISELMVDNKGLSKVKPTKADIGYLTERTVGTAKDSDIAKNLFPTYNFLADEITRMKSTTGSMKNVLDKLGNKIDDVNNISLGKNEVIVSPELYKEFLGEKGFKGSTKQTGRSIRNAIKGIDPSNNKLLNEYKGSLYKIDRGLLESLPNAYASNASSRLNSMFKGTQLSTMKWLLDNRWGNSIMNTIEGVNPADYIQGLTKYKKFIPEELKSSTSYSGYLGGQMTGPKLIEAEKLAFNKMNQGIKEGKSLQALEGLNQMFSNPIVLAESNLEKYDRWANMIRQAKNYSRETKIPLDKIMKDLRNDKDLFLELNKRVDRSLGDYLGRNYYLPQEMQGAMNWATPFYKFPTQSMRIAVDQLGRNPIRSQLMTNLPAKYGSEEWDKTKRRWLLKDNELGGVVLKKQTMSKMLDPLSDPREMIRFNANPIEVATNMAYQLASGDIDSASNLLSPVFSSVKQVADFKNSYGDMASSPEYVNYMGKTYNIKTGKLIEHATMKDRGAMALSKLAQLFVTPAVQADRMILPYSVAMVNAYDEANGKKPSLRYYPKFDTSITGHVGTAKDNGKGVAMFRGNTYSGKKGIEELTANLTGEREFKAFPDYNRISKSIVRQRIGLIKKLAQKKYRSER